MTEFQGQTSTSDGAINVILRAADAHPMELRSATQRIHLRVSDILTGDDTEASSAALAGLFKMIIPRDSIDHIHCDFLDRATYMTVSVEEGLTSLTLFRESALPWLST